MWIISFKSLQKKQIPNICFYKMVHIMLTYSDIIYKMAALWLIIITNKTMFIFGLLSLFNSILILSVISCCSVSLLFLSFPLFHSLFYAIPFHSLNLCHSAICFLGQFITSFQWCNSWPELFPPTSSRPITSFLVILSQSMTRNSMLMFCKPSL